MANMFSNKETKSIPHNLWECRKPDPTASNLHLWAERLERVGKLIAILIIIAGVICSLIFGVSATDTAGDETVIVFLGVFLGVGALFAIIAFFVYCAYHASALRIDALACITQNTDISANVALLFAEKELGPNDNVIWSAGQGDTRLNMRTPGLWMCSCGQTNTETEQFCKNCGKYK